MSDYPIEHSPAVELLKLPSDKVQTYDGQLPKLGSKIYFRFAPTKCATEYTVVSDRAILGTQGYELVVVSARHVVAAMNCTNFVADPDKWWEFWLRHYGNHRRRD